MPVVGPAVKTSAGTVRGRWEDGVAVEQSGSATTGRDQHAYQGGGRDLLLPNRQAREGRQMRKLLLIAVVAVVAGVGAIGINRIVVTDGHIEASAMHAPQTVAFKSDYLPLER